MLSIRFWRYVLVYFVPATLFIVLVVGGSWLSSGAMYAVSSTAPLRSVLPSAVVSSEMYLPYVPSSAYEAHAILSDEAFEYLAAAVVMARDRHQFESHSGGSGDRGVDVRLRNQFGLLVVVQAKRYDPSGTVPSYQVRDFSGSLGTHDAAYGYFVTTARLTPDGRADKERSPRRIHLIEGWLLDVLLVSRHREIAQCLYEIQRLEGR